MCGSGGGGGRAAADHDDVMMMMTVQDRGLWWLDWPHEGFLEVEESHHTCIVQYHQMAYLPQCSGERACRGSLDTPRQPWTLHQAKGDVALGEKSKRPLRCTSSP